MTADRRTGPIRPPTPDDPAASAVQPIVSLEDPRAISILSTEHWSLLTSRSLAYNEAFTRGGMFLSFLSMSFVALALFSSAMAFGDEFLTVAAVVLAFDFLIGAVTYGRIIGANEDDLRAVHGMARIRHAYTEIAPLVAPYFTSPIHDDPAGMGIAYGNQETRFPGVLWYGLTTSGGMIGLILSLVGGVEAAVVALLLGVEGGAALLVGIGGAIVVFGLIVGLSVGRVPEAQRRLPVMFPTPTEGDRPPGGSEQG